MRGRRLLKSPSRLRVEAYNQVNHAPGMIEGLPGAIPTWLQASTGLGEGLSSRVPSFFGQALPQPLPQAGGEQEEVGGEM